MLTLSTLGMFVYGAYSIGWALLDLIRGARLELWAECGLILFGALLMVAAAFVRVRLPGGLTFALGALLGLQALAVHDGAHLDVGLTAHIGRGFLAIVLLALAYAADTNVSRS
jgi:hypothetical protein